MAACFWIIVAILPQRELAKTVTVEKLIAKGRAREALDFLKQHQPSDFAPARPLPPKVFERYVYMELPACFAVVLESDPAWVRALLMSKLDSMVSHLESSWRRPHTQTVKTRTQQVENFESGLSWLGPEPDGLLNLLKGLQRLPEGQVWLATNSLLTEAIWKSVLAPETHQGYGTEVDPKERIDWLALSNYLHSHSFTNVTAEATNQLSTPAVPPTP